ncbi:MAG TPA: ATP-binding protein [Nitrospiraceae bacterium]|nr:ATP-binding protein [Nitrospiraceae bacterium]
MTTATPSDVPIGPARYGWGLKRKLIVSMLLVGVLPLLLGLTMAFFQGSKEIREVSGESFKALATEAARKLDLLVLEEVERTARIVSDPVIVKELEKRRDALQDGATPAVDQLKAKWETREPAAVKAITDNGLARLLRDYYAGSHGNQDQLLPQVVRAATKLLFITDVQGNLVAALTSRPDFSHDKAAWWKGAYNKGNGQLYIEDVYFDDKAKAYVFSISLPIMDSLRYEVVGVLHRVIDAKEFFSPSTHPIRFGKTGHVMLIDGRGIVISCPILPSGVRLSDPSLIPLVTPPHPGWVSASSDGHGGSGMAIIGFAPLPETSRATNGSFDEGAWHTFVWQSSAELFAPVQHLFTWMSVFGLVAIALLATLGYLAASRIVTPIRRLQEAARSVAQGQLREPIQINTGDELEELAVEFNRMNAQLEAAFAGLTSEVRLKTEEVQYLQRSTDQVLDAVPTPIIMIDQDEHIQYVNKASKEALSINGQHFTSMTLFDLLHLDHRMREKLRRELGHSDRGMPASHGRDAERLVPLEPRDPLSPQQGQDLRDDRHEIQIGSKLYRYQWFRMDGRSGGRMRIGLVLRDTTDESRLQDQLVQAEKSGSLGILTAGIGHELNNPLFGILGLGEAIQEEVDLSRVKAYARDIVVHGRRMAAIIRDFAGIATREAKDQRVPVDVNAELDQAWAIVQTSYDALGIEVRKRYISVSTVNALPDQLRQAFTNVLANAVQALRGQGQLLLSTEESDGLLIIKISDSGPGIPKHHLSKVFDPFFTTKGQGQGSGLGLTVAQRIVKKFGGEIRMESEESKGSTCVITLPVASMSGRKEESCLPSSDQAATPRSGS